MPRLAWCPLLGWALLGMALGLGLLLFNYQSSYENLGPLVDTSPTDSSAQVIGPELGPEAVKDAGFHDGHYYYLIARAPMHFEASVPYLDRAGYRLGRPALPWLAWALHPSGGGWGLVWAMLAVGVAGVFAGAIGTGALSMTLGGKPWVAMIFPVALGSVLSLRISVPDPMAAGFGICAIVLLYRRHLLPAVLLGALAVLSKESSVLLFVGVLVSRRDRDSLVLVGTAGGVLVAWQVWLRIALGGDVGKPVDELGVPLQGVIDSVRFWAAGHEPLGLVAVLLAVVLTGAALVKRGLHHPLSWVLVIQFVFALFFKVSVLGPERNGSRMVLAMTVIAVVMLVTPKAAEVLARADRRAAEPVPAT